MKTKSRSRLCVFTPDSFLDVDLPLLPLLNRHFELFWVITFSKQDEGNRKFNPEKIEDFTRAHGIDHYCHFYTRRVRDPKRFFDARDLIQRIKQWKPDLVYVETFSDPFLPLLARLAFGNSKVIVGIHDVVNHSGVGSAFHDFRDRFVFSLFHNFLFFSKFQQKLFSQRHPTKRTFAFSLPVKDFGPAPKNTMPSTPKTFLFFGTVLPYKGLEFLLEATAILATSRKDFQVKVSGKWQEYANQEKEERFKGVLNVDNRLIPNEEIPALFSEAYCLVLPYKDVTQSGPLLIGMGYNLPSLASDLEGFKEFIGQDETGWFFKSEDPHDLAQKMSMVLDLDSPKMEKVKQNLGQSVEKNFSIEVIAEKLIGIFEDRMAKDGKH